jgi:hypothetical protein
MLFKSIVGIGALALSVGVSACNRAAQETRDDARDTAAQVADATADAERERADEVTRLNERVAQIERDYAAKSEQLATAKRTATPGLREEVQEDVTNVKQAVANLSTTTAENWWEREEAALRRTVEDVGSDVERIAGKVADPNPVAINTPTTAPFTSRRDAFVTEMKGRVNAFQRAVEGVKATGPRETEVKDAKARLDKLAGDLDKLAAASADDWWNVTTDRVEEYLERVEVSVKRLDDDKVRTE